MGDQPKPCPLCGSEAVATGKYRRCSRQQCRFGTEETWITAREWEYFDRRPTVEELADRLRESYDLLLAHILDPDPPQDSDWRAIAEELLK